MVPGSVHLMLEDFNIQILLTNLYFVLNLTLSSLPGIRQATSLTVLCKTGKYHRKHQVKSEAVLKFLSVLLVQVSAVIT